MRLMRSRKLFWRAQTYCVGLVVGSIILTKCYMIMVVSTVEVERSRRMARWPKRSWSSFHHNFEPALKAAGSKRCPGFVIATLTSAFRIFSCRMLVVSIPDIFLHFEKAQLNVTSHFCSRFSNAVVRKAIEFFPAAEKLCTFGINSSPHQLFSSIHHTPLIPTPSVSSAKQPNSNSQVAEESRISIELQRYPRTCTTSR